MKILVILGCALVLVACHSGVSAQAGGGSLGVGGVIGISTGVRF